MLTILDFPRTCTTVGLFCRRYWPTLSADSRSRRTLGAISTNGFGDPALPVSISPSSVTIAHSVPATCAVLYSSPAGGELKIRDTSSSFRCIALRLLIFAINDITKRMAAGEPLRQVANEHVQRTMQSTVPGDISGNKAGNNYPTRLSSAAFHAHGIWLVPRPRFGFRLEILYDTPLLVATNAL